MCFIRDKDEGERPLLLSSNRKEVNSMEGVKILVSMESKSF